MCEKLANYSSGSNKPSRFLFLFALTYYSMVTLASIGATDVVPTRSAARGLTMIEAICGQFYVAVLIADLIGKRVSQAPPKDPAPAGNLKAV